ncbi:WD40 repeat-like protein [Polychaeton citri CBS 116435]|uniref:WD40 repeat-like protein n=1 Tax=Polychaeton citri CBS 116435 TaxID=1314669 RepID=A0A9P4QDU5_9PEZI|nr:WD40 repeat-like protein [Polychaeton citri CBS 116435]
MSSNQSRKDEIEKKRQKLAELKRQRELRQSNLQQNRQSLDVSELASPSPLRGGATAKREELDSLISSLVDRPSSSSPAGRDRKRFSGDTSGLDTPSKSAKSVSPARVSYADASTDTQQLAFASTTTVYEIPVESKPEYITYSKGVQTTEPWDQATDTESGEDRAGRSLSRRQRRKSSQETKQPVETEEDIRQRLRQEIEEELKALHLDEQVEQERERYPARSLAPEELNAVTSSTDFLDFVERSSKVIERALDEDYDVLSDYALRARQLEQDDEDEEYTGRRGRRIKEIAQYNLQDAMGTKRMISALDFSPKFQELLCTAYTKSPTSPHSPPGLLNVWNLHLKGRPEYSLHATSDLLSCLFHPYHPSLILGGTYSGQVCLWDTRARNQRTGEPVQKTPLMGGRTGHAHPVYSLSVVGTQNASSVVSVSTDGVVCAWSTDMLQFPQEYLELHSGNPAVYKTDDVAPTCISFPPSDPTYFLAGTEQGNILPVHRYDRAGAKKGVDPRCTYKGHEAPVMDIDFHPSRGKIDLGDLFVSSGLDWSVKLWRAKPPSATVTSTSASNNFSTTSANASSSSEISPLLTIPRSDAVYSTKWSPTRPSIFGLVDGAGKFDVYDLNTSSEVPVASAQPSHQEKEIYGLKSLNKLAWEKTQGKNVAVGGLDGVTTVFEVGSELGGVETKGDAWLGVKRWVGRVGGER